MIPAYIIRLKSVKKISPLKLEIKIEDEEPIITNYYENKIQQIRCLSCKVSKELLHIFDYKGSLYAIEDDCIKAMKVKLGDIFV